MTTVRLETLSSFFTMDKKQASPHAELLPTQEEQVPVNPSSLNRQLHSDDDAEPLAKRARPISEPARLTGKKTSDPSGSTETISTISTAWYSPLLPWHLEAKSTFGGKFQVACGGFGQTKSLLPSALHPKNVGGSLTLRIVLTLYQYWPLSSSRRLETATR